MSVKNKKRQARRIENVQLQGAGAGGPQDRGAQQTAAITTLNPYFNNNYYYRWQEYVRWYETAWEARKIITIPVQDALRVPVKLKGLSIEVEKRLRSAYEKYRIDRQLRRALVQERLLGGCVMLGVFNRPEDEKTSEPLDIKTIEKGDLLAVNVVDVSRLSNSVLVNDPFDPNYDKVNEMLVQGVRTHESRMCVLDGEALFGRNTQLLLQNFRFNPNGFGESILAPLYDTLVQVTGTRQGAYHLVNLASCLVVGVKSLRALTATSNKAEDKIKEIVNMLSIYRGAVVDGDDVEFKPYNASFGSVPELVMTFMQFLSAGSDIPATRFLGQAPGGLNATGESDLENYYNNIASWQQRRLKPIQLRLFNWLGYNEFGPQWLAYANDLELEYESLWNLPADRKATVDQTYATIIKDAVDTGLIEPESGLDEYVRRNLFKGPVKQGDPLQEGDAGNPFGDKNDTHPAGQQPKKPEEGAWDTTKPKDTTTSAPGLDKQPKANSKGRRRR